MTEQKQMSVDALVRLSDLAADFKIGIVSEEYVRELIKAVLEPMELTPEELATGMKRGMRPWTFED